MNARLALALGLVLAVTPASAAAQEDPSPDAVPLDPALLEQLCGVAAADETELDACMAAVEAALLKLGEQAAEDQPGLLEQAQELVDDTLANLQAIDLEQALDEIVANAQDFEITLDVDVQGAIDDAVAALEGIELPTDIDLQAALDDTVAQALASAEGFDLQAAVDAALAEAQLAIEEADLQGTVDDAVAALEDGVEEARAVVAEAQRWAQENREAVCRGGSVSLGTTVGVAVFALTGVEWLGLQAFWAMERFTNAVCSDLTQ